MSDDQPTELVSAPEAQTPEPAKRRGREFAKVLLSKLPELGVSQWESADTLDVYQDMQGVVDLDADAFLQPLEVLAEDRHGTR